MKYFIAFVLIAFSNVTIAQKLSFIDLQYILQHDVEESDAYLAKKDFLFMKSEKATDENKCLTTFWSYKRENINNRAVAFISKSCDRDNSDFVWYQSDDKQNFESVKSYCKSHGFKLTKTETNKFNDLCFTFVKDKFEIKFCSGLTDDTNMNQYYITFGYR